MEEGRKEGRKEDLKLEIETYTTMFTGGINQEKRRVTIETSIQPEESPPSGQERECSFNT